MAQRKKNVFQSALSVTVSLYVYAFVVSIFLSFSAATWLFGFVITKLGGKIELLLSWLLVFGLVYALDRFVSIRHSVNAIMNSENPEDSKELKKLSSWFLGFTALAIAAVFLSGFFAENMAFAAVKSAAVRGVSVKMVQEGSQNRQGNNGAAKLNEFLFSPQGVSIKICASLADKSETFGYFLERKWTAPELKAAEWLIAANSAQIEALKNIIAGSDYLQVISLPLTGLKDPERLNAYGYSFLEEYARQMAIGAKISVSKGKDREAVESLAAIVKLYKLLRGDDSGLITKSAGVKVQSVLAPAFAVMLSNDKAFTLSRPLMLDVILNAGNELTSNALKQETGLAIEKYRLIKLNRALMKPLTGISGPLAGLSSVTGALDISFYRLISDYFDASDELNIRQHTSVKALPYWPYLFTKAMEPDIIRFYRDETLSLASLKSLYALEMVKDFRVKLGRFPKSIQEVQVNISQGGLKDPYGHGDDFHMVIKGDYLVLYSIAGNRIDDNGSISDNKDIGHLLILK